MLFPERTFATVDHIIPTDSQLRPYQDALAEEMLRALESQREKVRHPLLRAGKWRAGHRPHRGPGDWASPSRA